MTVRLFVALSLPRALRDTIARLPLPTAPPGVRSRRVPAANLHLTVRFLGDVEPTRIPSVTGALRRASREVSSLRVRVGRAGRFPPRGAPRVIWVGAEGGDALVAWKRSVDRALAEEGFAPERRRWTPHVTVARIAASAAWRAPAVPTIGELELRSVELVRSVLRPSGAEHAVLASVPFGPDDELDGGPGNALGPAADAR